MFEGLGFAFLPIKPVNRLHEIAGRQFDAIISLIDLDRELPHQNGEEKLNDGGFCEIFSDTVAEKTANLRTVRKNHFADAEASQLFASLGGSAHVLEEPEKAIAGLAFLGSRFVDWLERARKTGRSKIFDEKARDVRFR